MLNLLLRDSASGHDTRLTREEAQCLMEGGVLSWFDQKISDEGKDNDLKALFDAMVVAEDLFPDKIPPIQVYFDNEIHELYFTLAPQIKTMVAGMIDKLSKD